MVATQEIQDHFSIPSAVSIPLRGCCQEIESAERELGAFLKAVQSLYGDDVVTSAADTWIGILESALVPVFRGLPNWRHVTVRASSRLALSLFGYKQQESEQMEGNDAN